MSFFARLLAIILGILLAPLRLLGLGPSSDSAQARAAMALADAEPAPANDEVERPPSPFAGADLGHLIKDHASLRLRQRHPAMPALPDLPFWAQHWFNNLDDDQLKKIVSPSIPGWLLQRHVLAGTAGTLPSLGYVTPAPKDSATGSASGGRDGKSAGGGVKPAKVDLNEILEELGYAPSRGMRPR